MTPPPIPAEILELLEEFAYAVEVNGYAIKHNSRTALLSAIARAIAGGRGEPKGWLCTKPQLADVIVRTRDRADEWADYGYAITPLYAPPAPEKVDG